LSSYKAQDKTDNYWTGGLWLTQTRRQKVCREMQIEMPSTSQADILQRLIRRYLFRLERMKEEGS